MAKTTTRDCRWRAARPPPAVDPGHPAWDEVNAEQRERAYGPGTD